MATAKLYEVDFVRVGDRLERVRRPVRTPDIATVRRVVSAHFRVRDSDLDSVARWQEVALARHVAMWCVRQLGRSYPAIGREFGNRDHTTAMSAVKKIEAWLAEPAIASCIEAVSRALGFPLRGAGRRAGPVYVRCATVGTEACC